MNGPRVCLTYDFDAVASLQAGRAEGGPTAYSRRLFGAREGAPRVLDLLDRRDVTATWFVAGHTIESFPEVCERIAAAGHAIESHGWRHVSPPEFESRAAEREDVERSIAAVEALTGRRPRGYRAPNWAFSEHTADLLRKLDFEWDSSLMEREFTPYYLRRGDRTPPDGPFEAGEETDLVEVPVSFQRDDWPPFGSGPGQQYVDERAVFRMWRTQFDWMCRRLGGDGVYVLTMHPQIIGFSHRLTRLEEFVDHVERRPDAAFATVPEVVEAFRDR